MSHALFETTGAGYRVERVCEVWEQARSTFYERRERTQQLAQGIKPGLRGAKPWVSDVGRLDLIRRDLAATPFRDPGHHKMWELLHFGQGL